MRFHDGLNVIVGANNSGKTGLMKALRLVSERSISVDDFNQNNLLSYSTLYKECAPEIEIEYGICHQVSDDDISDDSFLKLMPFINTREVGLGGVLNNGITEYQIKAKINATYALDTDYIEKYAHALAEIDERDKTKAFKDYKTLIGHFIEDKQYKWTFRNVDTGNEVEESEASRVLSFQSIEAERSYDDVRSEVRKLLIDIAKDEGVRQNRDDFLRESSDRLREVYNSALLKMGSLLSEENNAIGLKQGNVSITTDFQLGEKNIADTYRTSVCDTKANFTLPLDHNGLGYNNLINMYMLIKLNEDRPSHGSTVLCIEEPEAHLHPAMQYKLFKYLSDRNKGLKLKQQIFVSTHSSNISAVAGLDNMFMLAYCRENNVDNCKQQSLEELFGGTANAEKKKSKDHLTKFLDVTRSDMLFADKVILVEGIAERLLLPKFMEKIGRRYEDSQISIVEIGGRHFEHFLELFKDNAVEKKVLCITDRDFEWLSDNDGGGFVDKAQYLTLPENGHIVMLQGRFNVPNIKIVTQVDGGKTFEDELFITNISQEVVADQMLKSCIPDALVECFNKYKFNAEDWVAHKDEIDGRALKTLRRYIDAFENRVDRTMAHKEYYSKLMFAEIYLHYAEKCKGKVALDLLTTEEVDLSVPRYIQEGINWLCQ